MEPGSSRPGGTGAPPRTAAGIEVVIADAGWRRLVPRPAAVATAAARAALHGVDVSGALTVLLADDRTLCGLNTRHRGIARTTNVLSFPADDPPYLGDVALALGQVRREARAAGRRPSAHLAHLVAHGTLHLLGHDHLHAGDARRMERAESRAMHRLRLPDPWRAARRPSP